MAQPEGASIDRVWPEFGIWVFAKSDGTINHSTDVFLIDPSGHIIGVYATGANGEQMRRGLEKYL